MFGLFKKKTTSESFNAEFADFAKDLLKTSNLSIHEIADKVGYQDTGFFSALFKKHLAITPIEYRSTVRAKLFSTT